MAETWEPKGPAETVERRWLAPVEWIDGISSVSAIGTGVTVDGTDHDGKVAVVTLSGGTVGTVGSVTVTVVTSEGETFVETFLTGIRAGAQAAAATARDVCAFALRKITGIGEDPDADELAHALEVLNDMLAEWRIDGLDVGIPVQLVATDVLTVRDEFLSAIKYNLRMKATEEFGMELTPTIINAAERGRSLIARTLLTFRPLSYEGPCIPKYTPVGF